jgi:diguanylate cyclase (GGDEF)-like protein/PAS domain S-box-containing protein
LRNPTRSQSKVSTTERVVGTAKALQQLLQSRASVILDSCQDAILAKTLDGLIVAWNPAAERIYGYLAQEVIGKHVSILFPRDRQNEVDSILEKIRRGERVEHYESVRVRKDGRQIDVSLTVSPITGPAGEILGASAIARDITETKRSQERILYLAKHDSLTGLANYGTLMEAFEKELSRSDRTGGPFSVVMFDLDGLKSINDHFGHLTGSRALCRFAAVLRLSCRSIDTASRYGGDEFVLLLVETNKEAAQKVAERIVARLAADGEEPPLSVSLGVSAYPDDGRSAERLIEAADRAVYEAKPREVELRRQGNPLGPRRRAADSNRGH